MHTMLHWKKYDCPIYVICINESTAVSTIKLINILMNEDKEKFFSITKSEDETKIIIDEKLDNFNEEFFYKEKYVGYVLLDTNSFIEESGLLKKISTFFSQWEVPFCILFGIPLK